jgi:diacylglycerol O-acyltransferase / wax synthase
MEIERLADEDEIMLWADDLWPQDIGALVMLEGSALFDGEGRFRLDAAKAAIAARLHLLPRLRQLLYVPPKAQGGPLWVDATDFDLSRHVQVRQLSPPGSRAQLLHICEEFVAAGLDRSRPLWEMWFVTGLIDGRVGWLVKAHHCIADGIAGVATFATFLDTAPEAVLAAPEAWTPTPAPTEAELRADERQRRERARQRTIASLGHPVSGARELAGAWPAMRELLAEPALPPTSLTRAVGRQRRLALVSTQLEAVREIAHRSDAKVNDVLLAAIAGGLRRLLRHHGEPVEGTVIRVYVPVTLRPPEERARARGNQIAQMVVPLQVGDRDPVLGLHQIAEETARRKRRSRPSIGKVPHHGSVGRLLLKLIDRQRVNVTTADLPGPQVPLYFAGAGVLEVFPLLPLIGKVSLGVGALSYAGQFNVTVVADGDGYPDLEVFVDGLEEELSALASPAGARAEPEDAADPALAGPRQAADERHAGWRASVSPDPNQGP